MQSAAETDGNVIRLQVFDHKPTFFKNYIFRGNYDAWFKANG